MPTSEEPIIVRIVRETGNESTTSSEGKTSGGLVTGAAKLTGIFNLMQTLVNLVGNALNTVMKPVMSVAGAVMKLLAQFLRPAIDILIIGLMPILVLMKPLVKIFNEIMRPFRQIAMRMIKENPLAGALANTVILQGLATAMLNVAGQFIKTSLGLIIDLVKRLLLYPLADMLPGVSRDTVDKAMAGVTDTVSKVIDGTLSVVNKISLDAAKMMAKTMNVMVDDIDFASPMKKAQNRMQGSVNDFWNNLIVNKDKRGVTTGRSDNNIVVDRTGVTDYYKGQAKKYGIDYSENAGGAAAALQKLRNGIG